MPCLALAATAPDRQPTSRFALKVDGIIRMSAPNMTRLAAWVDAVLASASEYDTDIIAAACACRPWQDEVMAVYTPAGGPAPSPKRFKATSQNQVGYGHAASNNFQTAMAHELSDAPFFHINSNGNLSPYDLMRVGQVIEIGKDSCPFFRLYETWTRSYRIRTPTGEQDVQAVDWLQRIKDGHITLDDPNFLKVAAVDIARHFMMLARELVWENIRITEFPDAPSRQRCVWLIREPEQVTNWLRTLGFQQHTYWVVKVLASGKALDVDSRFLAGDSEPLPTWFDKARLYWRGETSADPLPETIFEGTLRVAEILDPASFHPKG